MDGKRRLQRGANARAIERARAEHPIGADRDLDRRAPRKEPRDGAPTGRHSRDPRDPVHGESKALRLGLERERRVPPLAEGDRERRLVGAGRGDLRPPEHDARARDGALHANALRHEILGLEERRAARGETQARAGIGCEERLRKPFERGGAQGGGARVAQLECGPRGTCGGEGQRETGERETDELEADPRPREIGPCHDPRGTRDGRAHRAAPSATMTERVVARGASPASASASARTV